MVRAILGLCRAIKDDRTIVKPMLKLTEEVGELSTEVSVILGQLPKSKSGKDGVIGEACDVIIAAIDVIHQDNPQVKPDDIRRVIGTKLVKWRDNEKTNIRRDNL